MSRDRGRASIGQVRAGGPKYARMKDATAACASPRKACRSLAFERQGACIAREHDFVLRTMGARTSLRTERIGVLANAPTIYVVHDDDEFLSELCAGARTTGLEVLAYAEEGTFLKQVPANRAGCLLAEDRDASRLAAVLAELGVEMPIVAVASDGGDELSSPVPGVHDIVTWPCPPERLAPTILRTIAADLARRWGDRVDGEARERFSLLTPREREVLELVVEGLPSREIAMRLRLSEKTVEVYRSHINRKMRTRNAVELTKLVQSLRMGRVSGAAPESAATSDTAVDR